MPDLALRDARLHYSESGAGTTLVLVHGTGLGSDAWQRVLPLLAANHRVIAYDRRGYGGSSGAAFPARRFHAGHGEDLAALLEALSPEPAVVLGWSAGSFAALHATLAQPQRVRRLVLYEPPLHAKRHMSWTLFRTFVKVGFYRATGRPQRAAMAFGRMVLAYSDGRNSLDSLPPDLLAALRRDMRALLAELEAGTGEELHAAALAKLAVPVTLMLGEQSPALFQSAMARARRIWPAAPLVTIGGANHIALVDQPEDFARALQAALAA